MWFFREGTNRAKEGKEARRGEEEADDVKREHRPKL